eukprot:TRINITY_DN101228_c0_g1_i1.p1 TRINITY_DN101228_c0_g1~~TRINITY_DN101228_c0_g1_i1.p1  ORF type:complete len:949 (+),score=173.56 TRINITY_DN101228_c0_g1_i1:97-2943(+)
MVLYTIEGRWRGLKSGSSLACRLLVYGSCVVACFGSELQQCTRRWQQDERLTAFYLRMSAWGEDSEALEKTGQLYYDWHATWLLLARGVSFIRLPSEDPQDEGRWDAIEDSLRKRSEETLRTLGGFPERSGICMAAMEVTSKGWKHQYREGSAAIAQAERSVARAQATLPPGRYCHAAALDRSLWDDLHISRLEIQEAFARDIAAGRNVLILRGGGAGPTDEQLAVALRLSKGAMVSTVSSARAVQDLDGIVSEMAPLFSAQGQQVDLVLLLGLPAGVALILAAETTCRFGVQALDLGRMAFTAAAAAPRSLPWAPVRAAASSFAEEGDATSIASRRPQWVRLHGGAVDLNGAWEVLITHDQQSTTDLPVEPWSERIKVPNPPQAAQGLSTKVTSMEAVWYRRSLKLPAAWCDSEAGRVYLHVDACDWECRFYVDRQFVGGHRGGYDPFTIELDLSSGAACSTRGVELLVRAWDPTDTTCEFTDTPPLPCEQCCLFGFQPRGKQTLKPGLIMYTGVTGLWRQGVWLERTPRCHLQDAELDVGKDSITVNVAASCGGFLSVVIRPQGGQSVFASMEGPCCGLRIALATPLTAWSPSQPVMYEAIISLDAGADSVIRPFAYRTISRRDGRILLNEAPVFMHGVLYQGYWPETLMTPPSHGAVEQDLRDIKAAGFNTVRVHAVVMGAAFYGLCDKLGLLVWQDMPGGDARVTPPWENRRQETETMHRLSGDQSTSFDEIRRTPESQQVFDTELQAMISWLRVFPSIAIWVLFNEGWGQSLTRRTVEWLRQADPSRLIDAASGWNDVKGEEKFALGDFADLHTYEEPPFSDLSRTFEEWPFDDGERARVLGEYGGLGFTLPGRASWKEDAAWGYGGKLSKDAASFQDELEALLKRLHPLLCRGLTGAIYTQWNDVETEVNGLLTYDRIAKLPLDLLRTYSERLLNLHASCTA